MTMDVLSEKKKRPIRVLMIAPEPILEPRGTPFSVYHRAKVLVTLGYEVDLVTYPIGKPVSMSGLRVIRAPGIPGINKVKIGPSLAKLPLDASLFLTAIWRMYLRKYHYIHTHEEGGLMGVILSAIFGGKHMYDMHSDLSQQMSNFSFTQNKFLIGCVEAVQKLIVRNADAVIAICPDLEVTVKKMAPGKAVYMIENVAVDEALPPASESDVARLRQQWKLGTDPVLLYTGTFEGYQGIDILLKSVAIVKKKHPNARYVLVGGKPEQVEKQRQLAQELGIMENVRFVGQRPLEEMPQYMGLADILLSPRSEGTNTPLKLYTYLRSGKPILATDIFSHSQILNSQMSMLVPPTPAGLAEGALKLLDNPAFGLELATYGQEIAEKNYSWPAFVEKNRKAYREFAGSPTVEPASTEQMVEVSVTRV